MTTDYDHQAERWKRDKPKTLSDFLCRPIVLDIFRGVGKDKIAVDLGCGEGYFSRQMARIAKKVIGVDSSQGMLNLAIEQEMEKPLGIEYHLANVRNIPSIPNDSVDVCVGNFITNYLTPEELFDFYSEIGRVLNYDGKFILLMPHPALHFVGDTCTIFSERENYDYIKSRSCYFHEIIGTVDGEELEVGLAHSTLEDHFNALSKANLAVTGIKEPVITSEVAKIHPSFGYREGSVNFLIMDGKKILR